MNRDGGLVGGRIAVVGSGAVGCYYGGRLAQGGNDVRFLMRRDLGAVRGNGLQVLSPMGDFDLPNVRAFGSTAEIGPSDLVIIALKSTRWKVRTGAYMCAHPIWGVARQG